MGFKTQLKKYNMPMSEHSYFKNGFHDHAKPDIVIKFKRPDVEKLKKWSNVQKEDVDKFIETAQNSFDAFIITIRESLKETTS